GDPGGVKSRVRAGWAGPAGTGLSTTPGGRGRSITRAVARSQVVARVLVASVTVRNTNDSDSVGSPSPPPWTASSVRYTCSSTQAATGSPAASRWVRTAVLYGSPDTRARNRAGESPPNAPRTVSSSNDGSPAWGPPPVPVPAVTVVWAPKVNPSSGMVTAGDPGGGKPRVRAGRAGQAGTGLSHTPGGRGRSIARAVARSQVVARVLVASVTVRNTNDSDSVGSPSPPPWTASSVRYTCSSTQAATGSPAASRWVR